MQPDQVTVSIQCLVYNHEPFLRDCLEGFVIQKTTFKFEAIVHDDASTDGSAAIIREYAEKYPDIIKPIYQKENLYKKDLVKLRTTVRSALTGKYIALCEGDDYWTDPYKLQKQVDFLEANPEYSMCFHNAELSYEGEVKTHFDQGIIENRDYVGNEFLKKWFVPTASVVVKRENLEFPYKNPSRILYGDIILFLTANELGLVRGMEDCMSVYRVQGNSAIHSSNSDSKFREKCLEHYLFIQENFKKLDSKFVREKVGWAYLKHMTTLRTFSLSWFKDLFYGLYLNPKLLIEKILGREIK